MNLRQRWKQTTLANQLMVITTAIVAFGTIFYVLVAVYQWILMKESGKQTTDQINKLIVAAQRIAATSTKSVTQAKGSLDASIDNFRLDQRAWVSVSEISPAPYVEGNIKVYMKDGQKFKGEVVIKNTGKTPAFKVRTLVTLHYQKAGEKIIIDKKKLAPLSTSNRIMHPGMIGFLQTSELDGLPNKADIENVVNRKFFVYITTFITYEDVFKRPHFTEHCAVLMPDLGSFGLCKTNNNAN